jgi:intein-encoded DNA endonuclease-like protein
MGRKKRLLTRKEIIRANFFYYTNQRNLTDVAKIMEISPSIIDRYLFKNKNEYYDVSEKWNGLDENEKVEAI